MILSAMMFALGVFVTGLLALGFCIALVRRTRRVTERRLMAAVSARRAEFEAERDELRARHAVQMHRLERELARVLDMATAHRLDADVKDRDLLNIKAELNGKDDEIQELQERLGEHREALQEVERKYAESSTALRAARHALKLESRRRTAMEDPLDQALAVADEKKVELSALQAQVETLRVALARAQEARADAASGSRSPDPSRQNESRASVIPLPVPGRPGQDSEPAAGWNTPSYPADDEGADPEWAASQAGPAGSPAAQDITGQDPRGGVLAAGASEPGSAVMAAPEAEPRNGNDENAETLFVEALAEIRALKRAASAQAAE